MPKASSPHATAKPIDPRLVAAVRALDDKKAEDILVLDLEATSTVARYFIIATATSDPHLSALTTSVEKAFEEQFSTPEHPLRMHADTKSGSGWYILDTEFVFIHLFTPAQRLRYNLEGLWGDAKKIKVPLA